MITTDDIAAAVFARANSTSNYATVLPGALWYDRAPDTPAGAPWGVFTVKAQAPEWLSGAAYVQKFTVSVMGYAPAGNTTLTPSAVEQFVNAALAWQQGSMTLRGNIDGEQVLAVQPMAGEGKFDSRLRQAKNVFTSGQVFELTCQGMRSVN